MPNSYDPNTLWVALTEHSEGNLFNVYPKLLAELLLQEEAARQEGDTSEAEKLVLPSDKEWRLQQYFNLVSMQKCFETDAQVYIFGNQNNIYKILVHNIILHCTW